MELFLNALWLALGLAGLAAWCACSRDLPRRQALVGLFALACIAILLFPVISATDDVYALQAPTEEFGINKKTAPHAITDCAVAQTATATAARPLFTCTRVVEQSPLPLTSTVATLSNFNRPPPPASISVA